MLTLRAAAGLLTQADSLVALRPVAHAMGFTESRAIARDAQRELAIDQLVVGAELARGPGRMHCLSAALRPHEDPVHSADSRELTRQLCAALLHRAPTRDWCVVTLDATGNTLSIATVSPHSHGPRITALRVDRRRVVNSDADTLRSLAATTESDGSLRHARFVDILGRDALSNRFYRTLDRVVQQLADSSSGAATDAERRELALLTASRCLFLAFLEAKGWLDHDRQFLLHHTTTHLESGGRLHQRLLRPLFFGTLNTPLPRRAPAARTFGEIPFLNGGLFSPTPLERRRGRVRFADDALATLLCDLLDRYRFTANEDSTSWSEAAIDPEMLGRAFESLMAADERHQSGTYYTPPSLVEAAVRESLRCILPSLRDDAFYPRNDPLPISNAARHTLHAALGTLRVLDPACGSGAFLVHMLESIATISARTGDQRPMHVIRREILTRQIFGVDRNPMAVWLCELRLWLSIVIDCPETRITSVPPLPNLDHNIRIGDTLSGGDFQYAPPSARRLTTLRDRYTRATGARKITLARSLEGEERRRALAELQRRRDALQRERAALLDTLRARDLFGERRQRTRRDTRRLAALRTTARELAAHQRRLELGGALPFRFSTQFADIAAAGGFSLVVGNPPWVRPHALPIAERTRLRTEFQCMRTPAWKAGAARAGAGAGFSAQADLSAAFVERSGTLLADGGVIGLLVPAKLWRALAGGGVRQWLHDRTHIHAVHDYSHAPSLFDAAVYPSLLVAERRPMSASSNELTPTAHRSEVCTTVSSTKRPPTQITISSSTGTSTFPLGPHPLSLDGDPSAPWLLMPATARRSFERLRAAGPALGDSSLGRPSLGVKCGYNTAFLVNAEENDDDVALIETDGHSGLIERYMLRPALRGEFLRGASLPLRRPTIAPRRPRTVNDTAPDTPTGARDLRIVWTHGPDGTPLRALPPLTARWLAQWRGRLESRRDARGRAPWWSLFRTDAARSESPRVVWADIGRQLRASVLAAGDPMVPLNSCYLMRAPSMDDAFALEALLASPIAAAWFEALAEPARGGFRRYMGWTVATLPIPADWTVARVALAELGRQRAANTAGTRLEQTAIVADAYGIPLRHLEPLLAWSHP